MMKELGQGNATSGSTATSTCCAMAVNCRQVRDVGRKQLTVQQLATQDVACIQQFSFSEGEETLGARLPQLKLNFGGWNSDDIPVALGSSSLKLFLG